MPVYVWEKYNATSKYRQTSRKATNFRVEGPDFIYTGTGYSFNENTGELQINKNQNLYTLEDAQFHVNGIYISNKSSYNGTQIGHCERTSGYWLASGNILKAYSQYNGNGSLLEITIYESERYYNQGSFIGTVVSADSATYPQNGEKDGYWYVFKETMPDVPSITVPGAAMAGQSISVTWEPVSSAEDYKLERKVDSNGWTQVYEGAELAYTDTVQPGWTSVQYRVSAGISDAYGTPTVSNTVSIIPASSLVISGTDGNLGTIKAPVTYSVTSDTGNQITVTEIINGHERTLTPTSGQLITIPVSMLDPGAGGITIKASVQADSGTVNQTRSWTYTKTTLALPVDPYRVERMQGKECDIFPQTLAEAVFMPDGSSVADKLGGATLEGAAIGTFTSSVTLPFTPDVVWVMHGSGWNSNGSSEFPFAMLYPNITAIITTGYTTRQLVVWDGGTHINSTPETGNLQPLNYVAMKFGGAS